MIGSLQSLRFIFAIMIFLHHFTVDGEGLLYAGGPCGVSFFMILSGFVMSVGYDARVQQNSFDYKTFLKRRLIRVYPLHLLCLLGFIILSFSTLSVMGYVKLLPNLMLLQSWIPVFGYYFSGNAVSWCLSCMLFFYMVYPFLMKGFHKYSKHTLYRMGLFIVLVYSLMLYTLPDSWTHPLLYISPIFRVVDFMLGILSYKLYCRLEAEEIGLKLRNLSFTTKSFCELFLIFLLVLMIFISPDIPQRYVYASYWWLIMPIFIIIFTLVDISGGVISTILRNRVLQLFDEFSFSFYMIHQLAISFLNGCLHKLHLDISWEITLPVYFIIIVFGSYLVYTYYEKPLASILKKKL